MQREYARIKRQYVWEKTGGLCWYCGARLYYREEADTEVKKPLVFTADQARLENDALTFLPLYRACAANFDNNHQSQRLASGLALQCKRLWHAIVRQLEVFCLKCVNHGAGLGADQRRHHDH